MSVATFAKPAPRYVPEHVTDLTQLATLQCKECECKWTAPNPVALYAKGVKTVEQWRCPFCHGDKLGVVSGSERAAPPRG